MHTQTRLVLSRRAGWQTGIVACSFSCENIPLRSAWLCIRSSSSNSMRQCLTVSSIFFSPVIFSHSWTKWVILPALNLSTGISWGPLTAVPTASDWTGLACGGCCGGPSGCIPVLCLFLCCRGSNIALKKACHVYHSKGPGYSAMRGWRLGSGVEVCCLAERLHVFSISSSFSATALPKSWSVYGTDGLSRLW